jgi:hypothetical protein
MTRENSNVPPSRMPPDESAEDLMRLAARFPERRPSQPEIEDVIAEH